MTEPRTLWSRLPFVIRLLLTASTALLVAGTTMVHVSASREAAEIRHDLQDELERELHTLPRTIAETIVVGDFATLQQMLDGYAMRPLLSSITLVDPGGTRLESTDKPHLLTAPRWFVESYGFADVQGETPVIVGGRNYGQLQVVMTATNLANRAWTHLQDHLAVLLLAILIDFFGIWLVLRLSLAPLKLLRDSARRMADGDLDVRVPTLGSPELRELITSFNQMVDALAVADRQGRQQAAELARQHERLQWIIEGTNVGTWEWNIDTGALVVNDRWAGMLGYRLDELEPISIDTWLRLVHPDDLPDSNAQLEKHFSGELAGYDCELRMRHREGHWVWVLDRGSVSRRGPHNEPLLMSGTHMDISRRKQLEMELEAGQHFMRSLIDIIPGMVGYWDASLHCCFANQGYREWFGRTAGEMQGIHVRDLLGQELYALTEPYILAALAGEQQHFGRSMVKLDGSSGYIWVHYIPDQVGGQVRGFFVLASDVTGLKQVQLQLEAANAALEKRTEEAEAASRAKSAFVANMSHEIRTPMNGVLGLLELMQHTELDERQLDYVRKAEGAARSLLAILNDILDYSKVEAGKLRLDDAPFHLDELWHNLAVLLASALLDKPVELLFDIDPLLPRVLCGDALRLQQILLNLAGNAVKFTESGEVIVRLRPVGHIGRDSVRIEFAIQDSGIGIPADRLAAIFEAFTQAESSTTRHYGGTGLGLAISQRLVHLMGGELQVESRPGTGSCFHFTLEFRLDHETSQAGSLASQVLTSGRLPARPRVLVVDDHPEARAILERTMRSFGWPTETAETGDAAILRVQEALAANRPFNVICLDWVMPGLDGWETARRIRTLEHAGTHEPVLLMVTARGRELLEERSDAGDSPLDGFLVKPVTPSALFDAISRLSGSAPLADTPPAPPHDPRPLEGLRLLLVEDNPLNQKVAVGLLEHAGASLQVATNGLEALSAMDGARTPFNAVLMDIQMPEMDGYEATRQLRASGFRTPIIAMTANALPADRAACLAAGMDDHIGKPIELRGLVSTLLLHCRQQGAVTAEVAEPRETGEALPSVPPGFNLGGALERVMGDRSFYAQLAHSFVQGYPGLQQRLQAAQDMPDPAILLRELHTLRGVAATLGADRLATEAHRLEEHIQQHGQQPATSTLQALLPALEQTVSTLSDLARHFTPESDGAADAGCCQQQLGELAELLAGHNMRAMDVFSQLHQEARSMPSGDWCVLEQAMQHLDFVTALDAVNRLRRGSAT